MLAQRPAISDGLQKRVDQGLVSLEDGSGFHSLNGFDLDGDGSADVSTFIIGPESFRPRRRPTAVRATAS